MKKSVLILFILCLLLCTCGEKSPTMPTPPEPPPVPECEKNHTAQIMFENRSNTNTTYDIIFDGSKLTTITPGTKSKDYTVAAGAHTFLFKVTNTSTVACTKASPNLAQCHSYSYYCTY